MDSKKSAQDFPYKTYLNILHGPLEVIDVQKLVDACTDKWWNQTLCKVNDSVVRLGIVEGEYHWHSHNDLDEFFYVVDGCLLIDLEDRVVDLAPKQGFVVPKGVQHRTRAPKRTVILMVERATLFRPAIEDRNDPQVNRARHAAEQLSLLRSARPRLRRHPVDLESGRAKNLRDSAHSLFGRSVAIISGAQLLFPITYIFGDIFTEVYGYGASRRAIWLGFFASRF